MANTYDDWEAHDLVPVIRRLKAQLTEAESAINAANAALHGYGVEDQGQAWDMACRILDEYQTRLENPTLANAKANTDLGANRV